MDTLREIAEAHGTGPATEESGRLGEVSARVPQGTRYRHGPGLPVRSHIPLTVNQPGVARHGSGVTECK